MARPPSSPGGQWTLDPADLETLDRLVLARKFMILPAGGRFYALQELIRAGHAKEAGTTSEGLVQVVATRKGKEIVRAREIRRLQDMGQALDDQAHGRKFLREVKDKERNRRKR